MSANQSKSSGSATVELPKVILTRTFDAPREVVFQAWTDPKQLAQWFGPHHFTNPSCEIDARVGGAVSIDMRGPDGVVYPNRGVIRELVAPEHIVFTLALQDDAGNALIDSLISVTFAEEQGKTRLTLSARAVNASADAAQYLKGMHEGWSQTLDRLIDVVPNDREIAAVRIFDAPRELVWKMWTEPKHMARWWGPRGFLNTIYELDVRPGGVAHFVMHGPDGTDFQNKLVYTEVVKPELIAYDHITGPLFHATVKFDDCGDQTRAAFRMEFESVALRTRVVEEYGAIEGMNQTMSRLQEVLMSGVPEEFVISRTLDAPRELVWKAWTEQDRMSQWFGPTGSKVTYSKNDLREGGIFHYAMTASDGTEMWGKWVYREVVPPQRLVWVHSFSDKDGGVTHHPMAPDWPAEILSTVLFDEQPGQKTTVTIRWAPINPTEAERKMFETGMASMNQGWGGTLDQLEAYLSRS